METRRFAEIQGIPVSDIDDYYYEAIPYDADGKMGTAAKVHFLFTVVKGKGIVLAEMQEDGMLRVRQIESTVTSILPLAESGEYQITMKSGRQLYIQRREKMPPPERPDAATFLAGQNAAEQRRKKDQEDFLTRMINLFRKKN